MSMNRRNFVTGAVSALAISGTPLLSVAAQRTRRDAQSTPEPEETSSIELYRWSIYKPQTWIGVYVAYYETEATAKRLTYDSAEDRSVALNLESYRELDVAEFEGNVRVFEGTLLPQYRTPNWREVKLYSGFKGNRGIQVTSNADDNDTLWVVRSVLEDGLPVTPYGFEIKWVDLDNAD